MVRQKSSVPADGPTWRSVWLTVVDSCWKIMGHTFRQERKNSLRRIQKDGKEYVSFQGKLLETIQQEN